MGLYMRGCSKLANNNKEHKQEVAYYSERIKTYQIDNDLLVSERAVLTTDLKSLKGQNKELYDEVLFWKKKKSKVEYITKIQVEYRDTGSTKTILTQIGKYDYRLSFDYDSDYIDLTGYNEMSVNPKLIDSTIVLSPVVTKTKFDSINVRLPLTVGIKTDKDKIKRVFVTTPDDKFSVTKLDGVDLIEKELNKPVKRFGVGPFVGYTVVLSKTGTLTSGAAIGVGLSYNFIRF